MNVGKRFGKSNSVGLGRYTNLIITDDTTTTRTKNK
jgi:hypothetical protein